jgi:hypothetical protein
MPYDYTDAPPPRTPDLIPDTTATISMHIRAGGIGEDGMFKRSGNGECEGLDLEFTVIDGPYKGRKFWDNFMLLSGTTDGQKGMADTNRLILKAILDSALGLDPNDKSAEARAARTVSIKQFQGILFIGRIGIEKGGPNKRDGGFWPDKNCLASVITCDKKEWHPVEQPPPFNGGGSSAGAPPTTPPSSAPPIQRPGWAS